jgi:hypothetical protein
MGRFRSAITVAAAAVVLGFAAVPAAHASQGAGNQWCVLGSDCINAWGGGPLIKAYGINVVNNDFFREGSDTVSQLGFGGPGSYNSDCIADYQNNPGDAKAALVPCSSGIPWGANLHLISCGSGEFEIYDYHWGGWLASGGVNGDQFYLNVSKPTCFELYPAY